MRFPRAGETVLPPVIVVAKSPSGRVAYAGPMTERKPTAAFESHDAFESAEGDVYEVETATFEATVHAGGSRCHVTCELPTLDAAVEGEDVADVVEEGWYETLERRLAEIRGVTSATVADPDLSRSGERVVVETSLEGTADPAGDALAVVNYVEGTWFQGVIPGYDYVEAVESVRERARQRGRT